MVHATQQTNPKGYKPFLYLRKDCIQNLSPETRREIPDKILQRIDAIETCSNAMARIQRFLDGLEETPKNIANLLINHSGPIASFTEMIAKKDSGTPFLNCGMFYVLERYCNLWNPVHIQEGAIQYE